LHPPQNEKTHRLLHDDLQSLFHKFSRCKFSNFYIIKAEGYSLGNSSMGNLIDTQDF